MDNIAYSICKHILVMYFILLIQLIWTKLSQVPLVINYFIFFTYFFRHCTSYVQLNDVKLCAQYDNM